MPKLVQHDKTRHSELVSESYSQAIHYFRDAKIYSAMTVDRSF